jgi:hypothetical protein
MTGERRKRKRIPQADHAGLVSLTGVAIAECVLRDISPSGARIRVEDPEIVPDYFKLKVPGARELPKCRVRWRSGSEIGLEFFGPK